MANESLLVAVGTSWNEGIYLQNLLPQLLKVCDKVLLVDDFSTDGTLEYIESLNDPKIEFYQRKFDNCANQFDFILQKAPKDNTWIYQYTADELPTTYMFDRIRLVLDVADKHNVDRIWQTVWHLREERSMASEIGGEIRLFRNDENHKCRFIDAPHERLDGKFDGHQLTQPNDKFGFVHFKQADPQKIQQWKTDYVEKGVYSLWDINRRLEFPTVALPSFVEYKINDKLREFLKWKIAT